MQRPSPALAGRQTPLVRAIAVALAAMATQAYAQTTPAAPAAAASAPRAAAPATDSITITGFRAAIESALTNKREDNGIVDVIRSEDIAKFPDTNLAESLQRIPGVVIDRDAGEGRNITVRGLGLDFTRVRINGIEALATTGGTDSSAAPTARVVSTSTSSRPSCSTASPCARARRPRSTKARSAPPWT